MTMLVFFMKLSANSSVSRLFRLLFAFLLLCTSDAIVKQPKNVTFPAVIAFGDLIVDQGNNNNIQTVIKANFHPYGKDFEGAIPTGRFCNGKTPADLIGNISTRCTKDRRFSAPPVGCVPSQRTLAGGALRMCKEEYNQAAKLFNTKLSHALDSLQTSLAQSRVVYIDIYNPVIDIIQNPHNYGFDVVDKGCCGTGNVEVSVLCDKLSKTFPDDSVYLFWDSYHPTEKGYKILVHQILQKYINRFV